MRPVIDDNQAIPLLKSQQKEIQRTFELRTKRDRGGTLERQGQTYMQGIYVKNRKESERDVKKVKKKGENQRICFSSFSGF